MAQIEKTDQIDHYLDQIDKKQDSSFKKKIFLFIGLLLLSGVSYVAYSQFAGDDSLADGSASINTNNIGGSSEPAIITVNNNNLDEDLLPEDEELDPELNPEDNLEDENPEDANDAAEGNAADIAAEKKRREEEAKRRADAAKENPTNPTAGVSSRTYTAAELANLPSAQRKKIEDESRKVNKNVAPSKNEDAAAKKAAADKAEADAAAAKKAVEDANAADKAEAKRIATEKEEEAKKALADAAAAAKAEAEKSASVTKDPSYPGGESRMRQFFARRISYPNEAIQERIEGNVNVRIKVDERGRIVDSQVVKGIGAGCDREVLRAINRMPRWEPAEKDGEPVAKYYLLSVAFKLPN